MFKFKLTKAQFDALDDGKKAFYAANESGDYILQVEGAVDRARLDEFRNTNTTLMQRLDQFKDVDPAKIQEMLENERKIAEKKLIDAGDIDGLVNQRTATMKQTYEQQVSSLSKNLDTATRQLETLLIDNTVREQATKVGVAPTAVDDVLLRAKTVFKVEEGRPVAKDGQGNLIYGKDGNSSLSVSEWIGGLKEQAPHLFIPSTGSGSNNNHNRATGDGPKLNPQQKIAAGLSGGSQILS